MQRSTREEVGANTGQLKRQVGRKEEEARRANGTEDMRTKSAREGAKDADDADEAEVPRRETRAARIEQRDEVKSLRSRSRGRTPSEMLARKQQILNATGQQQQQQQQQLQMSLDTQQEIGAATETTAESKLESLSALLKSQQLESAGAESLASKSLKSIDDIYILLAKKEKDLQLAAELGKVLLERNDELSKANERIVEDFSHKLELLEQEKHKLKRKLELLDGEHENRLIELQTDCNILKNQLEQQQQAAKQAGKEKSKLIDDLVQQNQRLTGELAEATKSEELLSSQLEQLNERLQARSSARSDRVAQVEALEDELQVLNRRKQDLERRLKAAQNEKADLVAAADEAADKALLLENLLNEKDLKIGELAIEIGELRDSSAWLSGKLESMIRLNERLLGAGEPDQELQVGGHQVGAGSGELRAMSERERAHLVEQLRELRLKRNSRIQANTLILAGAAERQRRSLQALKGRPAKGAHREDHSSEQGDEMGEKLSSDLIDEIYQILSQLHAQLLERKERLAQTTQSTSGPAGSDLLASSRLAAASSATPEDSGLGSADDEVGAESTMASSEADEQLNRWRRLVEGLRQLIEDLPCSSCHLMISERADFEQLQRLHARLGDEIRLKNDELLKFNAQNIEQQTELVQLEERVALLQSDLEACDKPKEEIVRLAWKARDEAVGRKNNAEIQLAKTRIENMQVSSQLMEVVQQKGELSQKLAQFEDDIHYMMNRSVRARFSWEEFAEETRRKQRSSDSNAAASGLQQLISLSSAILSSPKRTCRASATLNSQTNSSFNCDEASTESSDQTSPVSRGNLLANFKAGRLNLKFWQRNADPIAR